MENNNSNNESNQFLATRIWNKLVTLFESRISCKTHWKGMKLHNYCFPASDAVAILHEILTQHVKEDATRTQAKKLLQKFLLLKVIEDVKGRNGSDIILESKKLYRITQHTPNKKRERTLTGTKLNCARSMSKLNLKNIFLTTQESFN